uniref:Importin N-terminal domain-containing protein n=1 Tax=Glossina morsitans morsitans TaxID=37546 RepID=A0ABK9MHA7_GLOMM
MPLGNRHYAEKMFEGKYQQSNAVLPTVLRLLGSRETQISAEKYATAIITDYIDKNWPTSLCRVARVGKKIILYFNMVLVQAGSQFPEPLEEFDDDSIHVTN